MRQPCLLEERLVVVEAVHVSEQRQRAPGALVLRVVHRRRREDARRDPVLLHQRREVDPAAGRAVDADVRRRERADHVGRVPRAERRDDLVVVDPADDLDVDVRVLRVILGHDLLELAELTCAPPDPDGQRRRVRLPARGRRRDRSDARREHEQRDRTGGHCTASHGNLLLGAVRPGRVASTEIRTHVKNLYEKDDRTSCSGCQP